jgi:hypothetical protein
MLLGHENDTSQLPDANDAQAATALFTCDVCATEKPTSEYVRSMDQRRRSSPRIPYECLYYLVPEFNPSRREALVCIECITSHALIQFRDRGSRGITCVQPHNPDIYHIPSNNEQWQRHGHGYLPKKLHGKYARRTFEQWWSRADMWECPAGYTTIEMTLVPMRTPGYPHVECPECQERFCGRCRVQWHEGQTCSQYVAAHLQILCEEEIAILTEMAALGAKRCPK